MFDPDAQNYAVCGEIWFSKNDVDNLPKATTFIILDQQSNSGIGLVNVPHYYDGEYDYYIRTPDDTVISDVYNWKLVLGLLTFEDVLTLYPNPTSVNAFIKLKDAFLSVVNMQSASYS